jgi:rhodanese-related sulfurtransferase
MRAKIARPLFWLGLVAVVASAGAYAALVWPRQAGAGPISDVSVHDLHAANRQGALVLDVREPFEYAEGRVPGSLLVPLATVSFRAGEWAKDEPVYIICRSGNRSLVAAEVLVAAGYRNVRNVAGGMLAYEEAALPIER